MTSTPNSVVTDIRWVKQEDDKGCIIACLAMLTGKTYAEIKKSFPDLHDRGGLDFRHTETFLFEHGYAYQCIYRWMPPGNTERTPWPAQPWADVHLVVVTMHRMHTSHSVVLLRDGTVLDPLTPEPKKLSDYQSIDCMRAVYALSQATGCDTDPADVMDDFIRAVLAGNNPRSDEPFRTVAKWIRKLRTKKEATGCERKMREALEEIVAINPVYYRSDRAVSIARAALSAPPTPCSVEDGRRPIIDELVSAYDAVCGHAITNPKELKGIIRLEFQFRERLEAHRLLDAIDKLVDRASVLAASPSPQEDK